MGNFKARWRSIARVLLFSTAAFVASVAAHAQVKGYVVINPIAVCDSNGICPPFGESCGTTNGVYSCTVFNSPSKANATTQSMLSTPIGFVDSNTNINLTRAIWARAGLDVVFFPVKQYTSPANPANPWGAAFTPSYTAGGTYQTLHTGTVTCNDGTTVAVSPDLAALTGQPVCTNPSHGGLSSSLRNPPPAPSPAPPVATTSSNAINAFFVTTLSGPSSPLFGFSWINGNGIAIAKNTFPTIGPRFDTLAHEIGHVLALDHGTFGNSAQPGSNLLTTGASRTEPSTSGCSGTSPYGGTPNPSFGALFDLAYPPAVPPSCTPSTTPIAEQLNLLTAGTTCTTLSSCTNQQGAVLLSGFINPTLAATATAGGGSGALAAKSTSSSSKGGIPFEVDTGSGTGRSGEFVNYIIIALAQGLDFQGNTPAVQTGAGCNPSPCPTGTTPPAIIAQQRINGNNGQGNFNCAKQVGLSPPSIHCLQIFFTQFVAGEFVTFTLKIASASGPLTINQSRQLAGTGFTVVSQTNDTSGNPQSVFATTSTFETDAFGSLLPANSQVPDLTIPNQVLNTNTFVGDNSLYGTIVGCTPSFNDSGPVCPSGTVPSEGWD